MLAQNLQNYITNYIYIRKINEIIIHCSASEKGNVEQINYWHKKMGFTSIGYHFVILNGIECFDIGYKTELDGLIEIGRDLKLNGAHTLHHNNNTIGICLVGLPTKISNAQDWFTILQLQSLNSLIKYIKNYIPFVKINGHNKYSSKICPGFKVDDYTIINNL